MMTLTSIAALALALQAQPAPTDETVAPAPVPATAAASESAETAEKAKDENRLICKRTAVIGSKFKKKVCGTKEHWQTLADRSQGTARELKRRGRGLSPNGG